MCDENHMIGKTVNTMPVSYTHLVYHKCTDCGRDDLKWMQASASMPLVSKVVEIDGYKLLDGGVADSIPIMWFRRQGYKKDLVILTRPERCV